MANRVPESERASEPRELGTRGSWVVVQGRNATRANRHWGDTIKTKLKLPASEELNAIAGGRFRLRVES